MSETSRGLGALAAAFLAGVAGALAFAPFSLTLALPGAFGVLLYLLAGASAKRGALLGLLFGIGHFSFGFSWLLNSLHLHGGIPFFLSLFILLLLGAGMGLYPALFAALLARLAPRPALLPWVAPALWILSEWLRGWLFTGFPWNLSGYALSHWDALRQVADLGGVWLLSWLVLLPGAFLAQAALDSHDRRALSRSAVLVVACFGLTFFYGQWRYSQPPTAQEGIRAALVQGNIPQKEKWDPRFRDRNFMIYLQLVQGIREPVDLVVWPETSLPFHLQISDEAQQLLADASHALQAPLLLGGHYAVKEADGSWAGFNSLILWDESKGFDRLYSKHHLVPYGEYVPLRALTPDFIDKLTLGAGDMSAGPGPTLLPWDKGALAPLVCYEVIFPDEVRQAGQMGAKWLVNATNDAWFGEWAKPQHLAISRLRAVENRLPLIRVANTGLSAAFDHLGRELGRIGANERGVKVIQVPAGPGGTFYQRFGPWWVGLCLLMVAAARFLAPPVRQGMN